MATLVVNKTYADGLVLGEQNLDNAFESIMEFVNSGNISAENIQDNSITAAELQTNSVGEDKIATGAVTTNKIADGSVTVAKLAAAILERLVPAGRISAFGGDTAPTGWLLCDGTAVSRTTYATLFNIVGVRFGSGDGTTTFNTPDFRGRFLRGKDSATGRDPDAASRTAMNTGGATGDAVGSVQLDGVKFSDIGVNVGEIFGTGPYPFMLATSGPNTTPYPGSLNIPNAGLETRPKNANVNFIIKA